MRFATIWSNPPIRVGKAALHDLLERWLPRLADDGVAYLVVQKNLGSDSLQRWVNAQGWGLTCTRLSSAKAFRILEVRRAWLSPARRVAAVGRGTVTCDVARASAGPSGKSPSATSTAGPASSTRWPGSGVTVRRPPGTSTVHGLRSSTPAQKRVARAAAAAPVPHERVSPTPRSWTRIAMCPGPIGPDELDVGPVGRLRVQLRAPR